MRMSNVIEAGLCVNLCLPVWQVDLMVRDLDYSTARPRDSSSSSWRKMIQDMAKRNEAMYHVLGKYEFQFGRLHCS